MRTNSYIKQLLKKMVFPLIIILLLFPRVSFCWNITEYDGYVRAEEQYDGYILTLVLESDGGPDNFWEIKPTLKNKLWKALSELSDLKIELFVDGNPTHDIRPIEFIYNSDSNSYLFRGRLSESLLNTIKNGNSLSIGFMNRQLISLKLTESNSAIENLEHKIRQNIIIRYVLIGIASIICLLVAFLIFRWSFRKTKTIANKVTNTSHELAIIVKNKVEEARRNRLYNKMEESALDEMVREAVRQAMSEGVKPDVIKLCTECLGRGCHQCGNKGWTA